MIAANKYDDGWNGNSLDWLRNDCKRDWYADNSIHFLRGLADQAPEARRWIKANAINSPARLQDHWLANSKQDLYQSVSEWWFGDSARNNVINAFKYALDKRDRTPRDEAPPEGLSDAERLYWQAERAARVWSRRWQALERQFVEEAAAQRARHLLLSHLTPTQRAEFECSGTFQVVSPSSRRYRIRPERYANVDALDTDGAVCHRLCAHPALDVPVSDVMLAQLLMLRHDEDLFLQLARVHPAVAVQQNAPGTDPGANEMAEAVATWEDAPGDYRLAV